MYMFLYVIRLTRHARKNMATAYACHVLTTGSIAWIPLYMTVGHEQVGYDVTQTPNKQASRILQHGVSCEM